MSFRSNLATTKRIPRTIVRVLDVAGGAGNHRLMRMFARIGGVVALVTAGGCTALLGLDGDYHPAGSSSTQGGGGDGSGATTVTSTTTSAGGQGGSTTDAGSGSPSSSGTEGAGGSSMSTSSVSSSSTGGSDAGACPIDEDNDGYVSWQCPGGNDCADQDNRAHPGAGYFAGEPIMGVSRPGTLSYDFNCTNGVEKQTLTITCTGAVCRDTVTHGFQSGVACGEKGALGHCGSSLPCIWISDSMTMEQLCK